MVLNWAIVSLANAEATRNLGKILGQSLPAGSLILLEGDLGTGKTTLVQGIGEALGIEEPILSPTFNLINEYTEGRLPLYHLDLYRLQPDLVEEIHPEIYWEWLEVPPGITAIEWAERLTYKPLNYLNIRLTLDLEQQQRQANIRIVGEWDFDLSLLPNAKFL